MRGRRKEDVSAIYVSMPRWLRLLSGKTLKKESIPVSGIGRTFTWRSTISPRTLRDHGQSTHRPEDSRERNKRREKKKRKFYFEIQQSGKIIASNLFDSPARVMLDGAAKIVDFLVGGNGEDKNNKIGRDSEKNWKYVDTWRIIAYILIKFEETP